MERAEALAFLELSGNEISDFQVRQRLREKADYHDDLSKNAPSDFLRLVHTRYLSKVMEIRQLFPEWDAQHAAKTIEFPLDETAREILAEEGDAASLTMPLIVSTDKTKPLRSTIPDPPGWLIRHTEEQPDKTFILSIGTNYIGRKADAHLNPFIVIENDSFVSKVQAVVTVEAPEGVLCFYVNDSAASNGGKASSNGTYINGKRQRVEQKTELLDGDTIQVGSTKLVLRINAKPVREVEKEVKRSKFVDTVVLS